MEHHIVDQILNIKDQLPIVSDVVIRVVMQEGDASSQGLLQTISDIKESFNLKSDSHDQLISDLRQQIAVQTLIVSQLRSQINEREESWDQLGKDFRQAAQREHRTPAAQSDDSTDEMQTEAPVNQVPVLPQNKSDTEETVPDPTPIPGHDVTESALSTPEITRIRKLTLSG